MSYLGYSWVAVFPRCRDAVSIFWAGILLIQVLHYSTIGSYTCSFTLAVSLIPSRLKWILKVLQFYFLSVYIYIFPRCFQAMLKFQICYIYYFWIIYIFQMRWQTQTKVLCMNFSKHILRNHFCCWDWISYKNMVNTRKLLAIKLIEEYL